MIPSEMLAVTRLANHLKFAAVVIVGAFACGFGLAFGALAALRLCGWLLVTWGCQ